jgi:hypothetical protein
MEQRRQNLREKSEEGEFFSFACNKLATLGVDFAAPFS